MVKLQQEGARVFAAHVLEDALHYAENNQEAFVSFLASTCEKKQKLEDKKNNESTYIKQRKT